MGTIKTFEDLDIWKEGMNLVAEIYEILKDCKDYGLKDQKQRAAVSIPSNIAEGFERQSNKEFVQFLHYAKGHCGELATQLYIATQLKYTTKTKGTEEIEKVKGLSSKIGRLIVYRKNYKTNPVPRT